MKSKLHVVYIFFFTLFQCIKERIVLAMSGKALLRRFQRVPKRFVEDEGLDQIMKIGYACIEIMWYKTEGKQLNVGLKEVRYDYSAMEMAKVVKLILERWNYI